jgi:hypothetical protein
MLVEFLQWLQGTSLAVAVAEKWFPVVESAHVIALATVAGSIFMVDSRLLGFASAKLPFTYVSDRLLPWTWGAFGGAAITGTMMFMGNALAYYSNTPFRVKMMLLLLAGLNMLFFQLVTFRGVALWNSDRPPASARAAGSISIGLWCGIIAFGRWIGFTM